MRVGLKEHILKCIVLGSVGDTCPLRGKLPGLESGDPDLTTWLLPRTSHMASAKSLPLSVLLSLSKIEVISASEHCRGGEGSA